MTFFKMIAQFFTFWLTASNKYNKLKANEEKRNTSVSLGVQSIIQCISSVIIVLLCVWGLSACIGFLSDPSLGFIMVLILTVALAAMIIVSIVQGFIGSLIYLIYQFKLNKRAVRWVALAVWLAGFAAIAVFTVLILA